MEWVLMTLVVCVVVVVVVLLVRRRSREPVDRPVRPGQPMHMGAHATRGVEDSMSMRLPTGGNSGF